MKHPVTFVSLGPGDPELITLKGLKALQQADCIFYPATAGPNHRVVSRAGDILKALGMPSDALQPFFLPMSKGRETAKLVYAQIALRSIALHEEGKKVAIAAEGDAGFYSSSHYIYDDLTERRIPVTTIAGIPAFIASGALAGIHVVKQEEPLTVFPGTVSAEELRATLQEGKTAVIMKLSQCEAAVKVCMRQTAGHVWHYFENVGLESAFYTADCGVIEGKRFPYFSLMVIKP
ncbi:MAG: precorrin-2 C(20)-methyltransferase [Parabacteroides sp.]|nr:precorrin-2 C(20)-methyltransferase [Parabacteroides sp.]